VNETDFIDTNVTGTLVLLEAAVAAGVECFLYTGTTSTFGAALTPAAGEPAAWVTEAVAPIPKNIYGVTKLAAESLCELFSRKHNLPTQVLRTSRFFPEDDDDASRRSEYETANSQANELLYRRVEIEDVVSAHLLAEEKTRAAGFRPDTGFRRYIISATTPFRRSDLGGRGLPQPAGAGSGEEGVSPHRVRQGALPGRLMPSQQRIRFLLRGDARLRMRLPVRRQRLIPRQCVANRFLQGA